VIIVGKEISNQHFGFMAKRKISNVPIIPRNVVAQFLNCKIRLHFY